MQERWVGRMELLPPVCRCCREKGEQRIGVSNWNKAKEDEGEGCSLASSAVQYQVPVQNRCQYAHWNELYIALSCTKRQEGRAFISANM